jgi:hypothetical protein
LARSARLADELSPRILVGLLNYHQMGI